MEQTEIEKGYEIYDSIYMQVVELVEKDNISCGFYKDTANKLKDLYIITKRSDENQTKVIGSGEGELEEFAKWFNETQWKGGKGDACKSLFCKCDYKGIVSEYMKRFKTQSSKDIDEEVINKNDWTVADSRFPPKHDENVISYIQRLCRHIINVECSNRGYQSVFKNQQKIDEEVEEKGIENSIETYLSKLGNPKDDNELYYGYCNNGSYDLQRVDVSDLSDYLKQEQLLKLL